MFSCVVLYPYSLSLLFTCIALFPTLAEYQPVYSPLLFYLLLDYDCVQIVSLSRSRSTFRRATSRWCVSPVNLPVGYGAYLLWRKLHNRLLGGVCPRSIFLSVMELSPQ